MARAVSFGCGSMKMPDDSFGNALEVLFDYGFNGRASLHHRRLI